MGIETPTNFPFCSAGPVLGTKFPRMMPITMARKIHRARNRSRRPRLLKVETLVEDSSFACFSTSMIESSGPLLGRIGTGSDEDFCGDLNLTMFDLRIEDTVDFSQKNGTIGR